MPSARSRAWSRTLLRYRKRSSAQAGQPGFVRAAIERARPPVAGAQLDERERPQPRRDRDRQVRAPARLVGAALPPRGGGPDLERAGERRRGGERARVACGVAQRAVAAHRQAGDRAAAPRGDRPVGRVDPRDELADVVGLPARLHGPVAGVPVRVPAIGPAVGHDDDHRGVGGDRLARRRTASRTGSPSRPRAAGRARDSDGSRPSRSPPGAGPAPASGRAAPGSAASSPRGARRGAGGSPRRWRERLWARAKHLRGRRRRRRGRAAVALRPAAAGRQRTDRDERDRRAAGAGGDHGRPAIAQPGSTSAVPLARSQRCGAR